MNIMSLIKEHRYEFVCVVLALLLLLALWPALMLGSDAKQKAIEAQKLDEGITRLGGRGPDGVANESVVKARQQLVKQTKLEAQEVAELFKKRNQRKFLIAGLFPEVKDPFGFKEGYKKAVEDLYAQTLNAGWPKDESAGLDTEDLADIGMYVQYDTDLGVPEWADAPGAPSSEECWFGQVAFWIQQDLAQFFRDLNFASAKRMGQEPCVANATVKRIVYIEIEESYYVADIKQQAPSEIPGFGPDRRGPPGPQPGYTPPPWMFAPGGGPAGQFGGIELQPGRSRRTRHRRDQAKPFTERSSNDDDVLHFSFSVIIDSRCINEFLDLFSRKNLYTILNVSLSREDVEIDKRNFERFDKFDRSDNFNPGKDAAEDLVYGTDPIVRLDIDAELLLLREVYSEDIPEQVKKTVEEQIAQAARRLEAASQPFQQKKPARSSRRPPKKTPRKTKKN